MTTGLDAIAKAYPSVRLVPVKRGCFDPRASRRRDARGDGRHRHAHRGSLRPGPALGRGALPRRRQRRRDRRRRHGQRAAEARRGLGGVLLRVRSLCDDALRCRRVDAADRRERRVSIGPSSATSWPGRARASGRTSRTSACARAEARSTSWRPRRSIRTSRTSSGTSCAIGTSTVATTRGRGSSRNGTRGDGCSRRSRRSSRSSSSLASRAPPRRRGGAPSFARLPATLAFVTAWSVGEAVGYVRGPARALGGGDGR